MLQFNYSKKVTYLLHFTISYFFLIFVVWGRKLCSSRSVGPKLAYWFLFLFFAVFGFSQFSELNSPLQCVSFHVLHHSGLLLFWILTITFLCRRHLVGTTNPSYLQVTSPVDLLARVGIPSWAPVRGGERGQVARSHLEVVMPTIKVTFFCFQANTVIGRILNVSSVPFIVWSRSTLFIQPPGVFVWKGGIERE